MTEMLGLAMLCTVLLHIPTRVAADDPSTGTGTAPSGQPVAGKKNRGNPGAYQFVI